jgi:hypothetical protein
MAGQPLFLVAVPTESGQTLVEIDEQLYTLLVVLPQPPGPALDPLIDDELAVQT